MGRTEACCPGCEPPELCQPGAVHCLFALGMVGDIGASTPFHSEFGTWELEPPFVSSQAMLLSLACATPSAVAP